jgi:hypothetical protein
MAGDRRPTFDADLVAGWNMLPLEDDAAGLRTVVDEVRPFLFQLDPNGLAEKGQPDALLQGRLADVVVAAESVIG